MCRLSLVAANRGYSLVAAHRLIITVASLLVEHGLLVEHVVMGASIVVAHGLICPKACGIFLDQGWNPCPLHWQVGL